MKVENIFGYTRLAQALVLIVAFQSAAWSADADAIPVSLKIVDVKGDGATGPIGQRTSQQPAVRIVDEKDSPVAGAAVVFTLPTDGATGVFGNGEKTLTVVTDARGNAAAPALRFNDIPGKVPVHVNVSFKGLTARTTITQTSVAPAGYKASSHHRGGHGKVIAILVLLGAGGAGAAVFATQKGSGTSTPNTPAGPPAIGVTPGTGTIAPPR